MIFIPDHRKESNYFTKISDLSFKTDEIEIIFKMV